MKSLTRSELKQIQGGVSPITCGTYHCICSRFHPEWEAWDAYYCDSADMVIDTMANCPDYGDGQWSSCDRISDV